MTEHKHAWVLRAIADGEPIDSFEIRWKEESWEELTNRGSVLLAEEPGWEARRKPRTIRVGEFDVPEPMREAPKHGAAYWVAMVTDGEPFQCEWEGAAGDKYWLSIGLCHATREAAQLHIDALLAVHDIEEWNRVGPKALLGRLKSARHGERPLSSAATGSATGQEPSAT